MRTEQVELTNMVMLTDHQGRVLVQERMNRDWPGVTFPGGHVEHGESFVESAVREMREETGLTVLDPVLCGLKQWSEDGRRYIVFFFKATQFTGELRGSDEGRVFWLDRKDLPNQKLANNMMDMVRVFEEPSLSEFYHFNEDSGEWDYKLL